MKKLVVTALLVTSFGASAGLFSSDTDDAIQIIKEGSLDGCPYAIGDMIDSAFAYETWKSGKTKSGRVFVDIEGDVNFRNQEQKAFMQFEVDGDEFWLNTLKLNNQYQSQMMARSFANHLCDSVK
ncbi:hypothetical protein [Vibrio rotiferianus]|uniref:hypothetical protein n=1 Tax=Vibrio rotiferianus TaxID=190895 RepID=UPI002895F67D|nr:conserved exported hypothetical protein [Vibrio rotiferianus]CAH1559526.1 conserved exported hypothetical protein [Vibrio rotiferianus]